MDFDTALARLKARRRDISAAKIMLQDERRRRDREAHLRQYDAEPLDAWRELRDAYAETTEELAHISMEIGILENARRILARHAPQVA